MFSGPYGWSHLSYNIIPPHHAGAYSWAPCSAGDVPPHALKVGKDLDGGNVYLGRARHEGDLIPAKVAPNHGGAFVPWGCKEHSKFEYEVSVFIYFIERLFNYRYVVSLSYRLERIEPMCLGSSLLSVPTIIICCCC